MFELNALITLFDAQSAARSYVDAVVRAARKGVEYAVEAQAQRMRRGQGPEGAQAPIKEETRRAKIRAGFPGTPLVRTGRLSEAAAWRIRATQRGAEALPPEDRERVVEILRARGFRFGMSKAEVEQVRKIVREEMAKFRLSEHMRTERIGR